MTESAANKRRQHRAAAMDVKFGDVLAGRAGRPRKPQHHRIVDRLPAAVAQQRRAWPSAAPASCPPASSAPARPAARRRAPRRSRSAAGRTTAQRWSGLADAWPICPAEKATAIPRADSSRYAARLPQQDHVRCNKSQHRCKTTSQRMAASAQLCNYINSLETLSAQRTPCCISLQQSRTTKRAPEGAL